MKNSDLCLSSLTALLLITGCESASHLKLGMTQNEVQTQFGKPLRVQRANDGSAEWFYEFENQELTSSSGPSSGYEPPTLVPSMGYTGGGETQSYSTTWQAKSTVRELSIGFTPAGRVDSIPNGRIMKNTKS
jgi:outer membrane protein assembly factor BamE (lipoprotein component of BamABCDE complex)